MDDIYNKVYHICMVSVEKCDIPMDLVYIVDTTNSINDADFNQLKGFLIQLNTRFNIGVTNNKTRVSVIQIGEETTPNDMTMLGDSLNDIEVNLAIIDLKKGAMVTNTASALDRLTDLITVHGRDQAIFPSVALIIIDGTSVNSFQTKLEASRAHEAGIHVVVAAVGPDVAEAEVSALASNTQSIFRFNTFTQLYDSTTIDKGLCEAARGYTPPEDKSKPTIDILGDCKSNMDIVFVIDASESISTLDFNRIQGFIINFIDRLDIGLNKIRIGLISYASVVNTGAIFNLDASTSFLAVYMGVMTQALTSLGAGTNTAEALDAMQIMFRTYGRPTSPFVGIVITDGASNNMQLTLLKAQQAKNNGIHMVAVGFGSVFQEELYGIATDPSSVKIVPLIEDLTTEDLLGVSCAHDYTCPAAMEVVVVWDLHGFDAISRTRSFVDDLQSKFSNTNVQNIFVDHVDSVVSAVQEASSILTGSSRFSASWTILIITDKVWTSAVKADLGTLVSQIKSSGIIVGVIDAAPTSNGLETVPSNNKLHFFTTKFDILPLNLVIKRSLCIYPCGSGEQVRPTGDGCEKCPLNTFRDSSMSFRCVDCTSPKVTKTIGSTRQEDCLIGACSSKMDVVFVIDASESIANYHFNMIKAFLINTISLFDIGIHRVGWVPFSNEVFLSQVFELTSSTNKETVINGIMSLIQEDRGYGTNTARAIDVAKDMMLLYRRNEPDVFEVIVVLTDGVSNNKFRTLEEASQAQQNFIRMVSVGLGSRVFQPELQGIASDEDSVIIIDNFVDLASRNNFINDICDDTYACSKVMDVTVLVDNSPSSQADPTFAQNANTFINRFKASSAATSVVNELTFNNMGHLATVLTNQQASSWTRPEITRVFLIITKMDLLATDVQQKLLQIRKDGGIVAVVNANPSLSDLMFASVVSNTRLLFANDMFWQNPQLRFIERKLCISACPSGQQRDTNGNCQPCSVGKYRTAASTYTCIPCPAGKTTVTTGATSEQQCVPDCGPGTFTSGTSCIQCTQGTYQPLRLQSSCNNCPGGKTTLGQGTKNATQCIANCPAGTRRLSDESGCVDCPVNTYQSATLQTTCLACPGELTTSSTRTTSIDACQDACGVPMDVVFLVDSSTSIETLEYALIKGFLVNNINRLKVGQSATRFGIISFAHDVLASPRLKLSESVDAATAISVASRLIQGQQDGTNTAAAFQAAVQMFATEGILGRPRIIFVITDGMSNNMQQTVLEATKAKRQFIHVYSLGVGTSAYEPELRAIATDKQSVILEPSFINLLGTNILPVICQADFACELPMDITLIKNYDSSTELDNKFNSFQATINQRFSNSNSQLATGSSLSAIITTIATTEQNNPSNPGSTKAVIIFTNKPNDDVPSTQAAATAAKNAGFVVSVVYASNTVTDRTYDTVVSNSDFLFYTQSFDETPYEEFILTSCCIAPCGDGKERKADGTCGLCPLGTYRNAAQSRKCVSCGIGSSTNGLGSTSASDCTSCSDDEILCDDMTMCISRDELCDGTPHCSDGSDEDCECPLGYYGVNGKVPCIKCPDGTTTPNVASTQQADCSVTCDESGQQLVFPEGTCEDCPVGWYRDKDLHIACVPCQGGFTTEDTGSPSQAHCVPDCAPGEKYDIIIGDCVSCSRQEYQPDFYQYGCIQCPDGTVTPSPGSISGQTCQDPCDDGTELVWISLTDIDCVECPFNTYKSAVDTACRDCQPGYITLNTGATSSDDCLPDCPVGYFFSAPDGQCQKCPFGKYQDEPYTKECKTCQPGTSNNIEGATSADSCTVPCVLGQYMTSTGKCEKCAVGYYRNDPATTTCTKCETGYTTLDTGATTCIRDCPPGTYISGTSCVDCEFGFFQTQRQQTSCTECVVWKSTTVKGATDPNQCIDPCDSGTYLVSRDPLQCVVCSQNTYRENGIHPTCQACPTNHITVAPGAGLTSDDCKPDCDVGERYDTVTGQCVDCAIGEFQNLPLQWVCIECPDGYTTIDIGSTSFDLCVYDCSPGYYWNDNTLQCEPCGIGRYQPDSYMDACYDCPAGTSTTTNTATECVDVCGDGQELPQTGSTVADCIDCPLNTYRDASTHRTCQPCRTNFVTTATASTRATDCIPNCMAGTYYSSSLSSCVACERGRYQDLEHQTSCKACPDDRPTTIQPGAIADGQCVTPCSTGQQFTAGVCQPCPVGTIQPLANQATPCQPCPVGQTTASVGSTTCIDLVCAANELPCLDGSGCFSTSQECDGTPDCDDGSDEGGKCDCVAGEYWNINNGQCEDCEVGTYQPDAGMEFCFDCAPGKYTVSPGSDAATDCQECLPGKQFLAGDDECTECPKDQFRSLGQTFCENCPANFVTESTGSISIDNCTSDCPRGSYFTGKTCEECPVGTYQPQPGLNHCFNCDQGTTTSDTGRQSSDDCEDPCDDGWSLVYDVLAPPSDTCVICPVGTYKSATDTVCRNCPAGFTNTAPGSTSCLPDCRPGTYYTNPSSSVCTDCSVGWYQFESIKSSCIACPSGTTTTGTRATTINLCYDPCGSGLEYNSITKVCDPCPVGKYKERNVHTQCQPCKNNLTTKTTASTSEAACVPDCDEGEYYEDPDCEPCMPGYYQPSKNSYDCIACPKGTYVSSTGSTSVTACTDPCPLGQELIMTTSGQGCANCLLGWTKVPPSTVCTKCPSGFVTAAPGSVTCIPDCQAGWFYDTTRSRCLQCPQGTYQSQANSYFCYHCDIGLSTLGVGTTARSQCIDPCSSGHELQFDGTCKPCEQNYYRTKNVHMQCQACPNNFFTPFEGSTQENDCLPPCLTGSYWDKDLSMCMLCPSGSYTDQNHQKVCKQCGTGLTTLNSGGTDKVSGAISYLQCKGDCLAGSMWDAVARRCVLCPMGTYQNLDYKDYCVACLQGYKTLVAGSKTNDDCYDPCDNGMTYNRVLNKCEPCGYNRYRNRDVPHNLCVSCDPGLITLVDRASSIDECIPPCTLGEEWNQGLCIDCAVGKYQNEQYQWDCKQCPNMWTTKSSRTINVNLCVPPCSIGQEWSDALNTCVACPKGTYQNMENELTCIDCPSSTTTVTDGATNSVECIATQCASDRWDCDAVGECGTRCDNVMDCSSGTDEAGCDCPAGNYFDLVDCEPCPLGTYQTLTGQTFCVHCPSWKTTDSTGSTSSGDCKDKCPAGYKLNLSGSCIPCPVGSYREVNSGPNCVNCPSGYITLSDGSGSSNLCVPDCLPGNAFNVVTGVCDPCPLGYYQDEPNSKTCKECPQGKTTFNTGTTDGNECQDPCPDGEELLSGTLTSDCTPCPVGKYKAAGNQVLCEECAQGETTLGTGTVLSTDCLPMCGKGERVNPARTGCDPCPLGFYQDEEVQLTCKACENWKSTLDTGSMSPDDCENVCGDGLEISVDKTQCIPCGIGEYRDSTVDQFCEECPPERPITASEGSDSVDDCVYDCDAGEMHSEDDDTCIPCDLADYQDLPYQTYCKDCPAWQTTDTIGSDHISDCRDICPGGSVLLTSGLCEPCPRGFYREEGVSGDCVNCRPGWTTLAQGSDSVSDCVPDCAAGDQWDEDSDSCVPCDDNYYNPSPYQMECQACPPERPLHVADHQSCMEDCYPGSKWNIVTQACNWCHYGQYDDGVNAKCANCPVGYTTLTMGSTSSDDCFPISNVCALYQYYDPFTRLCHDCGAGMVPDETRLTCTTCPANRPLITSDRAHCMGHCSVGKYWSVQSESCLACPVNMFQNLLDQESCKACPTGQTTNGATGATSSVSCQSSWCTGGQVYDPSTQQCVNCAAGSQNCVSCQPGSYQVSSTTCAPCPENFYQDQPNQDHCIPCTEPLHTMGIGATICRAEWCDPGTKKFEYANGTHECIDCGYGKYRNIQDVSCLECPEGTSTLTTRAALITDCVTVRNCGPGFFSRPTSCEPCPLNTYNDKTGFIKQCTPCAEGLHTFSTGASQASQCRSNWCDPGLGYNPVTDSCHPCGLGLYRARGMMACVPCPAGTTTTTTTAASEAECQEAPNIVTCPPGKYKGPSSTCLPCPLSTFKDVTSEATSCNSCPLSYVTKDTGSTSFADCQSKICAAGFVYDHNINKCIPCGYMFHRALNETTCQKCPNGQTTKYEVADSINNCIAILDTCPNGYQLNVRTRVCQVCPYGHYRNSNVHCRCVPCKHGYTTLVRGAPDVSYCLPQVCTGCFDLLIAVDATNKTENGAVSSWIKTLLRRITIDSQKARVGLLAFSDSVTTLATPQQCYSYASLHQIINDHLRSKTAASTNTAAMFQRAREIMQAERRTGRPFHVIVITDSLSSNFHETKAQAGLLHDGGASITYISTRPYEINSLLNSASSWFYVSDYSHLPDHDDIVCKFCPNIWHS